MAERWNGRSPLLLQSIILRLSPRSIRAIHFGLLNEVKPLSLDKNYEDIHLPKNTPMGIYIGIFSLFFGFAMTWHICWLAIVSFMGIVACLIIRLSGKDEFDIITAAEVKEMEDAHLRRYEAHMSQSLMFTIPLNLMRYTCARSSPRYLFQNRFRVLDVSDDRLHFVRVPLCHLCGPAR